MSLIAGERAAGRGFNTTGNGDAEVDTGVGLGREGLAEVGNGAIAANALGGGTFVAMGL